MIAMLLVIISVVPNPMPPEMMIEVETQPAVVIPKTGTQFNEQEMRNLVEAYFPADRVEWALRVSKCESRWLTTAKNPRTSAAGLFQFKRSTWDWVADQTGTPDYDEGGVWEVHSQMINAAWLVENGGRQHWVCK